jgi:hypothetical protein
MLCIKLEDNVGVVHEYQFDAQKYLISEAIEESLSEFLKIREEGVDVISVEWDVA